MTRLLIDAADASECNWALQKRKTDYNFHAVHYAVWHGNFEMLKMLLGKGADVRVEHTLNAGGTPLQLAISRNATRRDFKFISLLLKHDLTDSEKKSLLTSKNNYFLKVVADQKMVSKEKQQLVKLLLDTAKKYEINPFQANKGEQQQSALHLAVLNDDSEMLELFYKSGASFGNITNKDVKTALELALDDCLKK